MKYFLYIFVTYFFHKIFFPVLVSWFKSNMKGKYRMCLNNNIALALAWHGRCTAALIMPGKRILNYFTCPNALIIIRTPGAFSIFISKCLFAVCRRYGCGKGYGGKCLVCGRVLPGAAWSRDRGRGCEAALDNGRRGLQPQANDSSAQPPDMQQVGLSSGARDTGHIAMWRTIHASGISLSQSVS